MAFTLFVKTQSNVIPRQRTQTCLCSINSHGLARFNAYMVSTFQLQKSRYAHLYYDAETQCIGVKMPVKQDDKAFVVTADASGGKLLSLMRFLTFHTLRHVVNTTYAVHWDAEMHLYVMDLTAPLTKKKTKA